MDKVIAIILNYNTSRDCEKCLSYLCKQDYDELSIVIVDNASPNAGEKQYLQLLKNKYDFNLIFNKNNFGFSAGNNIGLKWAKEQGYDWALIINPDVELRDTHYISKVMTQKNKWKDVAVIGTNVILPTGERQNPQRESTYLESIMWPIEMLKTKISKRNRYLCENIDGYCDKVTGACFFIKMSFVEIINYLDENVFMYSEEAILGAQVKKHNMKELYLNSITANHEHYSGEKAPSRDRMLVFIKSRLYFYENYMQMNSLKLFICKASLKLEKLFWTRRCK